jgi:Tfp pilus assembly protein PilO
VDASLQAKVIAGAALLLAGAFGYTQVYSGKRREADRYTAELEVRQKEQGLAVDAAALLKRVDEYRKRLAPKPEISWLMREALTALQEAGVQPQSVTPGSPTPVGEFTQLAVSLQFRGTYEQLAQVLATLERSPYLLQAESIDIMPLTSEDPATATLIRMDIVTLYLPANAGTG